MAPVGISGLTLLVAGVLWFTGIIHTFYTNKALDVREDPSILETHYGLWPTIRVYLFSLIPFIVGSSILLFHQEITDFLSSFER